MVAKSENSGVKSETAKPRKASVRKSNTAPVVPELKVVSAEVEETDFQEVLKKKELVELVMARTSSRKGVTRETVEACLEVLGEMLVEGREVSVPPFHKLRVAKMKEGSGGHLLSIKACVKSPKVEISDLPT